MHNRLDPEEHSECHPNLRPIERFFMIGAQGTIVKVDPNVSTLKLRKSCQKYAIPNFTGKVIDKFTVNEDQVLENKMR